MSQQAERLWAQHGRTQKTKAILPLSLPPRGLSRAEAAAYVGVSPTLFDEAVRDGRMPPPKRINSRVIWDRLRLDQAVDALPDGSEPVDAWANPVA